MTTNDGEQPEAAQTPEGGERVLHVVEGYAGFHLVTQETLDAARSAQDAADAAPCYENFGELRRSGDLEMLTDRLGPWDLSLSDYIAAIEQAAERTPTSPDLGERLAALDDVDFDGDDDANAPSDSTNFRSEYELDNEVEDHFTHTLETRMCDDVPADILIAFDALQNPMFVDYQIAFVPAERLDAMISALEARGFTVIRH